MKVLQAAQSFFFNEKFWLADNVTWDDFKIDPDNGIYIPQPVDLWKMFPAALGLFVVRAAVEKYVFIFCLSLFNMLQLYLLSLVIVMKVLMIVVVRGKQKGK